MVKTLHAPSTALYPVPAIMATCGSWERPNIITLAWVGTLNSSPPNIGISVRPTRFSYDLLKDSGEFIVNVPTADLLRVTDYCGNVSGRNVDKFAETGLTAERGQVVNVPLIAECPLNIECQVTQTIPLGSHELFIGKVVAVHMSEELLDSKGNLDLTRADPIAYGGGKYWQVGSLLGMHGFSVKR